MKNNIKLHINDKVLLSLFILLPWFVVIKYKLSNSILYLIIISTIIFLISFNRKLTVCNFFSYKMILFHLLILNLIIVISYQALIYNSNYYFYVLFYGSNIMMMYVFLILGSLVIKIINNSYRILVEYYFLLMSLFIIIDYILMHTNNIDWQLLYGTYATGEGGTRYNNLIRPLGLYGQATVNATLVIFHYVLLLAVDYQNKFLKKSKKIFYSILLIIVIVLQGSGTGGFLLILFLFLYAIYNKIISLILLNIFITIFVILIPNYFFENIIFFAKISPDGIEQIFKHFFNEFISYVTYIDSFHEILFGVNGNNHIKHVGELGSLKMIYHMGIIYFLLFSLLYIYLIYITKNIYYKIALILLLVGTNHYDSMFWSYSMIILLPLIYFDILFNKQKNIKLEKINYEY